MINNQNDHTSEQGLPGSIKKGRLDQAISEIFPGREFSEQELSGLRKMLAKALKENQEVNLPLNAAVLRSFTLFRQIGEELLQQLEQNPEAYQSLSQESLGQEMTFSEVALLNPSEAEMVRAVAQKKLEAAKQSSPDNQLNLGQKINNKTKPKPR